MLFDAVIVDVNSRLPLHVSKYAQLMADALELLPSTPLHDSYRALLCQKTAGHDVVPNVLCQSNESVVAHRKVPMSLFFTAMLHTFQTRYKSLHVDKDFVRHLADIFSELLLTTQVNASHMSSVVRVWLDAVNGTETERFWSASFSTVIGYKADVFTLIDGMSVEADKLL